LTAVTLNSGQKTTHREHWLNWKIIWPYLDIWQ